METTSLSLFSGAAHNRFANDSGGAVKGWREYSCETLLSGGQQNVPHEGINRRPANHADTIEN